MPLPASPDVNRGPEELRRTRTGWPYIGGFTFAVALLLALYTPLTNPYPYAYDSADYIYASQLGFWANYVDSGSLSLWDFLRKGIQLKNNPQQRAAMSQFVRSHDDPQFYRHYHGPLYFYFLRAAALAGVRTERGFRLAGLALHICTALLLMLAFWSAFPQWTMSAGLLAGVLYMFNWTALVTAGEITQHIAFALTAVLTLWAMSLFCREFESRFWYLTLAGLAVAFVAVETALLLAITLAVVCLTLHSSISRKWPDRRKRIWYLVRGSFLFLVILFAIWPAGIFKLSVVRGFAYLLYIAVERKTFSPGGALDSWLLRFRTSPWEHWMLITGFVTAVVLWRRLEHRREILPWLAYSGIFIVSTTQITVSYAHYRGSLALVWTMASAAATAHLWKRWGSKAGFPAAVVLVVCAAMQVVEHRDMLKTRLATPPAPQRVLEWVRGTTIPSDKTLYVPYVFVPVLHLYHQELKTVGYDSDWSVSRLTNALSSPHAHQVFLCTAPVCNRVQTAFGSPVGERTPIDTLHDGQPLYAMTITSCCTTVSNSQ